MDGPAEDGTAHDRPKLAQSTYKRKDRRKLTQPMTDRSWHSPRTREKSKVHIQERGPAEADTTHDRPKLAELTYKREAGTARDQSKLTQLTYKRNETHLVENKGGKIPGGNTKVENQR